MKTTTELQARLEELWEERKAGARNFEIVELIEEVLRLREEVSAIGLVKLPRSYKLENIPPGPVKWITGKPYRNE